jgi:hypothetical protein
MDTDIHQARLADASAIQAISAPIVFRSHVEKQEWKGELWLFLSSLCLLPDCFSALNC